MDKDRRSFYEYYSSVQEPWDGPALLAFTDGRYAGAVLDRNGLRPARILEFKDGHVILASELGLLPLEADNISRKARLKPGKFFLIDFHQKRLIRDQEFKHSISTARPYAKWLAEQKVTIDKFNSPSLEEAKQAFAASHLHSLNTLLEPIELGQAALYADPRLKAFNYTAEQINMILTPMVLASVGIVLFRICSISFSTGQGWGRSPWFHGQR